MERRIYGQVTIPNGIKEEVWNKIKEDYPSAAIEQTSASTSDDIFEVTRMRSLSNFAADNSLFSTIIFSVELTESLIEKMVDITAPELI